MEPVNGVLMNIQTLIWLPYDDAWKTWMCINYSLMMITSKWQKTEAAQGEQGNKEWLCH